MNIQGIQKLTLLDFPDRTGPTTPIYTSPPVRSAISLYILVSVNLRATHSHKKMTIGYTARVNMHIGVITLYITYNLFNTRLKFGHEPAWGRGGSAYAHPVVSPEPFSLYFRDLVYVVGADVQRFAKTAQNLTYLAAYGNALTVIGDITITRDTDDLVIDGNGHAIDAQGKTRIFYCTGKILV